MTACMPFSRASAAALRVACAALAVVWMAGCAQQPPIATTPSAGPDSGRNYQPAYTFAPGDDFDLKVPDASQLDQSLRVRSDGSVAIPPIGDVRMQGRSVEDVQTELRQRFDQLAGGNAEREYLLRPSDELDIKFPFQSQFNESVRIRPDGKIQLQMIGVVQAEGTSPEELQRTLIRRYARYLRKPDLAVIVRSTSSQSLRTASGTGRAGLRGLSPVIMVRSFQPAQVFVGGEVGKPGTQVFRPGLTLLQAMVEAGGQLPSGDASRLVVLRRTADDRADVIAHPIDGNVLRSPDKDMVLRPFDVVLLPKSGAAALADNLNQYVFNLVPFLRNSSVGATYNINGYRP